MRFAMGFVVLLAMLLGALLAIPTVANAHPLDELVQSSFLTVHRDALRLEVDLFPGARVAGAFFTHVDSNHDGRIDSSERSALVAAVRASISLRTAHAPLEMELGADRWPEDDVLRAGEGMIRIFWRAPLPASVVRDSSTIEFDYENRYAPVTSSYLVNALVDTLTLPIISMSRSFSQQQFTVRYATRDSVTTVDPTSSASASSVTWSFVLQGMHHVAIGFDHILFVLALLLAGGRWQRIAAIVSAFTIAHSITLSLAVLGVVAPPVKLVEPAIAATVAIMGWRAFLAQRSGVAPSERVVDLRLALAFGFGLLHGFGFAAALMSLQLPTGQMPFALAGFNVGVELAQLTIVLVAWPAISVLRSKPRILQTLSLAVAAMGAYWVVERLLTS